MWIADLHIHSRYSRATSRDCTPETLDLWARKKGIDLVGTGDFTHPAWREELKERLCPAEDGFYRLKEEYRLPYEGVAAGARPRFVLSTEISSIYKKWDKVRKVHNVILLPGLEEAEVLSKRLELIGNLHSDGRPILGLDSRDLLEITLECCPEAIFIPAHIWTPHFSLFGAFSGFQTIEECYEDLTPYIHAVETGLSSDPLMNWRLSALDSYTLVSNSDAHSPSKLGREANLLTAEFSYQGLRQALTGRGAPGMAGTIEFYPEEGKYHYDGHRNCHLCLKPSQTEEYRGICPVCGKKITVGVLHRVEELADRPEGYRPERNGYFESLVPLSEIIGASLGIRPESAKVQKGYEEMLRRFGSEFSILRSLPTEEIAESAGECIAEGIKRARMGKIFVSPGFDGEYGKVSVFGEGELAALSGQLCLFGDAVAGQGRKRQACRRKVLPSKKKEKPQVKKEERDQLNEEQMRAVTSDAPVIEVVAGPGTGKTKTLVAKAAYLVKELGIAPEEITAVTFTNQAAEEMKERLSRELESRKLADAMHIGTFHGLCLELLMKQGGFYAVADPYDCILLMEEAIQRLGLKGKASSLLRKLSACKNRCLEKEALPEGLYDEYERLLKKNGLADYDDLLLEAWKEAAGWPEENEERKRFSYLLVDELQDSNELQHLLLEEWGRFSKELFLIGDPDQSIYGFRGARSSSFLKLREKFPNCETVELCKNYRSSPEILRCAGSLIQNNPERHPILEPQRPEMGKVQIYHGKDDFAEALFITKEINRMVGGVDMLDSESLAAGLEGGLGFSDIAVLYRTHRQAELLELCFQKEGIPYLVRGRDSVLEDPLVRGILGFFRFLVSPADKAGLRACLLFVEKIPRNVADSVLEELPQQGKERPSFPHLTQEIQEALDRLWSMAEAMREALPRERPQKLLEEYLRKHSEEKSSLEITQPVERLLHIAVFYHHMEEFLRNIALGTEGDIARSGSKKYQPNAVSLMTFHGAKGLEFPVVFLFGVKKGMVPLELPGRKSDIQEERRLFYVGMTRAKERLIITHSQESSAFLNELSDTDIVYESLPEKEQERQLSFF